MAQQRLDHMFSRSVLARSDSTDAGQHEDAENVRLTRPFACIHSCLQNKGDYAVVNMVSYMQWACDFQTVHTRGTYVPPHDGRTYMHFDNASNTNPDFFALEQYYEQHNFSRLPCGLLSQQFGGTRFDWLQAAGWTMEGCAATVILCTEAKRNTALYRGICQVAETLTIPVQTIQVPNTRKRKRDLNKEHAAYCTIVRQLVHFVRELGEHNGHIMLVNMLSGTHDVHLGYVVHLVPVLLGMSLPQAEEMILRTSEQDLMQEVRCKFDIVPEGVQFTSRTQ